MKQHVGRRPSRLASLLVAFALGLLGVVGLAAPASAATGNILPPFNVGETWYVYQGYGPNAPTHNNNDPSVASLYGLDLTYGNSTTASAGRTVRAPMSGTVYYYQASYGNLCVNTADGGSYTLTHINSSVTNGSVTAGQAVGTVAAAQPDGSLPPHNNGVAHIHFQTWSAPGCWANTNGGMPFDSAHGRQICGAPDFTATGPSAANNGVWSGTVFTGAACGTNPNTYKAAFQSNDGNFYLYDPVNGAVNTTLGMKSGTSPATTGLYGGGHESSFQDNQGNLWVYGSAGNTDTALGMMSTSSPSIDALTGGGYQVAFQSGQGQLWVYGSLGSYNTALGMMPTTSPSIAGLAGNSFEVAFNAWQSGSLYLYNPSSGAINTTLGIMHDTSPSITGYAIGGYEVAFQASGSGNLYLYNPSSGATNTGLGMMPGTSPSIAHLSNGGFEVAFQANDGNLYLYNSSAGATNLQLGMMSGTSPHVLGLGSGGFEVAFQDDQGNLWVYGSAGNADTLLGMGTGTSPSIG